MILLTGRSFSGKSTVSRALERSLPAAVVSYDAINAERGLHGGRGVPLEEWSKTNGIAHERAEALLAQDRTVVVDDTSSPRFLRDEWRELAQRSHARFVLLHVDVDPESVRDRLRANRREARRHDVLDPVMDEHLRAFEPPASDERHVRIDGTADVDVVTAIVRSELSSS